MLSPTCHQLQHRGRGRRSSCCLDCGCSRPTVARGRPSLRGKAATLDATSVPAATAPNRPVQQLDAPGYRPHPPQKNHACQQLESAHEECVHGVGDCTRGHRAHACGSIPGTSGIGSKALREVVALLVVEFKEAVGGLDAQ